MRTKVVYTLISTETDYYLEQALLSVHSLKKHNPKTDVEIIVDKQTETSLIGKRRKIKDYVSTIKIIETPTGFDKIQKSRYLKTNLRRLVEGDFLFIDCDTIICGSLKEIDKIDEEIAMVADLNGDLPLSDKAILERCQKAQFDNLKGKAYFNSGVIYAKDTPEVHKFYEDWYEFWKQSSNCGINYDQPALCATNAKHNGKIREISGIWNCQYKMQGYPYMKDAKIMHYYANNGKDLSFFTLPINTIFQEIKDKGIVTPPIDRLLNIPQEDFYAISTVTKDQWFIFTNSHLLFWFTNRPALLKFITQLGKLIEKMIYRR